MPAGLLDHPKRPELTMREFRNDQSFPSEEFIEFQRNSLPSTLQSHRNSAHFAQRDLSNDFFLQIHLKAIRALACYLFVHEWLASKFQ